MCTEALSKDVPDWFTGPCGPTQLRVIEALNSPPYQGPSHNSGKVVWDKQSLRTAMFQQQAPLTDTARTLGRALNTVVQLKKPRFAKVKQLTPEKDGVDSD